MLQANLKTCEGLYHASTVVGQFLNLQLANRNVFWATRKGLGEQGWLSVLGVRFCKASPWSSPPLRACLLSPLNSPQKVILPLPSRVFTLFLLNGDGSFLQEVRCKQWLSKWGWSDGRHPYGFWYNGFEKAPSKVGWLVCKRYGVKMGLPRVKGCYAYGTQVCMHGVS